MNAREVFSGGPNEDDRCRRWRAPGQRAGAMARTWAVTPAGPFWPSCVSCLPGVLGGGRHPWEWPARPSPAGEAHVAAEHEVDERVDGAIQGRQVLNDHRGVDTLPGVWKEAEVVQHVEEEVWTPTADEGWVGGDSH